MSTMTPARVALGGLGVLVGLYGAYLALSRLTSQELGSVAKWLVGGVLVHDVLIAVASLVVGALVVLLPMWTRGAVAAGLVVLATVTVVGVPVMTRKGVRAVNPSLLDRHYLLGWLVLAALVLLGVVVGALLARRASVGPTGAAADLEPGHTAGR